MTERPTVSIHRASPADAEGILDRLRAAFAMYQDTYTPAAYQDTVLIRDTINQRLLEMSVFVAATEAGEIVGTIGCKVTGNGEGHPFEMPLFEYVKAL